MINESAFRKKAYKSQFGDWFLFVVFAIIFVLLPMLFAWSSMGMIHNRVYGPRFLLSKTVHINDMLPIMQVRPVAG